MALNRFNRMSKQQKKQAVYGFCGGLVGGFVLVQLIGIKLATNEEQRAVMINNLFFSMKAFVGGVIGGYAVAEGVHRVHAFFAKKKKPHEASQPHADSTFDKLKKP